MHLPSGSYQKFVVFLFTIIYVRSYDTPYGIKVLLLIISFWCHFNSRNNYFAQGAFSTFLYISYNEILNLPLWQPPWACKLVMYIFLLYPYHTLHIKTYKDWYSAFEQKNVINIYLCIISLLFMVAIPQPRWVVYCHFVSLCTALTHICLRHLLIFTYWLLLLKRPTPY